MAIQTITYTNKVDLNTDNTIPAINKVVADDMNEIKGVVNNNANELDGLVIPGIQNTQSNSSTDAYSCDYVNKAIQGTTLYDNSSGTAGDITLSDTLANYNKIDIQMKQQDDTLYWLETLLNPDGKSLWITKQQVDVARSRYYLFDKRYSLSGTSINKISVSLYSSNNNGYSSYDNIRIIKVVGYK